MPPGGAGGSGRAYDVTERFRVALRQEYFKDAQGARTGFDNKVSLWTTTVTLQYRIWRGLVGAPRIPARPGRRESLPRALRREPRAGAHRAVHGHVLAEHVLLVLLACRLEATPREDRSPPHSDGRDVVGDPRGGGGRGGGGLRRAVDLGSPARSRWRRGLAGARGMDRALRAGRGHPAHHAGAAGAQCRQPPSGHPRQHGGHPPAGVRRPPAPRSRRGRQPQPALCA